MVQVIILKVNSSQSSLISFACSATPSSKKSFQLFRVTVAIFLAYSYIIRYYNRNYKVIGIEVLLV